jgi:hypothetical protein
MVMRLLSQRAVAAQAYWDSLTPQQEAWMLRKNGLLEAW